MFPSPPKRTSLDFLLFCQVLSPRLSICSIGHTHRNRAVCHQTQMPSCGRYSFSSISLLLGKIFRQSKENSPGTAFVPALWLILRRLVSRSCSDLLGLLLPYSHSLSLCLSLSCSLAFFRAYLWFVFDLVKLLMTARTTLFWLFQQRFEQRWVGIGRQRSYGKRRDSFCSGPSILAK